MASSISVLHNGQERSEFWVKIFLFSRLDFVGNRSESSLHVIAAALIGVILFHTFLKAAEIWFEGEVSAGLWIKLYPFYVLKHPFEDSFHFHVSSEFSLRANLLIKHSSSLTISNSRSNKFLLHLHFHLHTPLTHSPNSLIDVSFFGLK